MSTAPRTFKVVCSGSRCGRRKVLAASGILVCVGCDAALELPRAAELADVPVTENYWPPL